MRRHPTCGSSQKWLSVNEATPGAALDERLSQLALIAGELAEKKGFEPSIPFPVYSLSRGAPSTTRPPLRSRFQYAAWTGIARLFSILWGRFYSLSPEVKKGRWCRQKPGFGYLSARFQQSFLRLHHGGRRLRAGIGEHGNRAGTVVRPKRRQAGTRFLARLVLEAGMGCHLLVVRAARSRIGTQISRSPDARCA